MKPWYVRHTNMAWGIIIACGIIFSTAGVMAADAIYHLQVHLWTAAAVQVGFAMGGALLGIAVGLVVVVSIRSTK